MILYKEYNDGRSLVTRKLGKSRNNDPEWPYRVLIIYLDEEPVDAEITDSKIDELEPDKEADFTVNKEDYRNALISIFEKLKIRA